MYTHTHHHCRHRQHHYKDSYLVGMMKLLIIIHIIVVVVFLLTFKKDEILLNEPMTATFLPPTSDPAQHFLHPTKQPITNRFISKQKTTTKILNYI